MSAQYAVVMQPNFLSRKMQMHKSLDLIENRTHTHSHKPAISLLFFFMFNHKPIMKPAEIIPSERKKRRRKTKYNTRTCVCVYVKNCNANCIQKVIFNLFLQSETTKSETNRKCVLHAHKSNSLTCKIKALDGHHHKREMELTCILHKFHLICL